ncbi:MAG: DNA translocase FtsK [Clostridia bacterium]|nr:DNA translocase FtsK [Clostridia bacterium]
MQEEKRPEKMSKEQKKEEKEIFKLWRNYCSSRYKEAIEKYFDELFDLKDLKLLIQNEGNLNYQLQLIIKKQEEDRKKEAYQAIITADKPLAAKLLEDAERDLKVLEDRLHKLKSLPYYKFSKNNKAAKNDTELIEQMDEDIKFKNTEVKKLETRIDKTKKIIESLLPLQENEKETKAPGGKKAGKTKQAAKEKDLLKEANRAYEELVLANKVSASLLQTKMAIGYNKATRLINVLIEQKKVVVEENGKKKLAEVKTKKTKVANDKAKPSDDKLKPEEKENEKI